jgi:hypothetical protein
MKQPRQFVIRAKGAMTTIGMTGLSFLARPHMPHDPLDQAPFFGRRGRNDRRGRFDAAAK